LVTRRLGLGAERGEKRERERERGREREKVGVSLLLQPPCLTRCLLVTHMVGGW
jgi:hypothetical protein